MHVPRRSPSPCSTATTGCCAPTRPPTGAGGCPSRSRTSTRATSPCCSPSRTGASAAITASIRLPSGAPAGSSWRHRRIVSGGSTLTMQVARLLAGEHERTRCRQGAPGAARAATRAQALQGRDPAPLPAPRAVRRQPGGRARRLARLLRQGAAPSVAGGGGPAGRPAAVAGAAPARPLPAGRAARPQPRSGACRCPGRHSRRRSASAPRASACRACAGEFPMLAPHLADTAVEQAKSRLVHRLTIDAAAQASLEQLMREHAAALGGRLSAARDRGRSPHRRGGRPRRLARATSTRPATAPST